MNDFELLALFSFWYDNSKEDLWFFSVSRDCWDIFVGIHHKYNLQSSGHVRLIYHHSYASRKYLGDKIDVETEFSTELKGEDELSNDQMIFFHNVYVSKTIY